MNEHCEVVRDLIPLCLDGAAAQGSQDLVQNHLAECEKCAGYYEAMQKTLPKMNEAEQKAQQAAFDSLAREMQRKKKKSTLKKVLLGIGIGVVAVYLLLLGFSKVARIQVDVSPEDYDVRLSRLEDGRVVCTVDYQNSNLVSYMNIHERKEENGERAMEFVLQANFLKQYTRQPAQNQPFLEMEADDFDEIDACYVGRGENRRLIWMRGDEIPKASEKMETYYFWNDLQRNNFELNFDGTPEGKAFSQTYMYRTAVGVLWQKESLAFREVPEWQPIVYDEVYLQYDEETVNWILEKILPKEKNNILPESSTAE